MRKLRRRAIALLLLAALALGAVPAQAFGDMAKPGAAATIYAGAYDTAVLTSDGSLWEWGRNASGKFGNGTTEDAYKPVKVADNVKAFSTFMGNTARITKDGALWTCGNNGVASLGNGELGVGTAAPVKVLDNAVSVSVGGAFMAAVTADGGLWTWGSNSRGQVGNGGQGDLVAEDITYQTVPTKIMDGVAAVSAGSGHTIAIGTDGGLWGWGRNDDCELGSSMIKDSQDFYRYQTVPVQVTDYTTSYDAQAMGTGFQAVSSGTEFTLAVNAAGELWGWGKDKYGQIGVGRSGDVVGEPKKILDNVICASAGGYHAAAVTADGSLWTWGRNHRGQLGNGTNVDSSVPVKIMDHAVAVAAGGNHTVALTSDGTVWTWGCNDNGQLGNGTTNEANTPQKIMNIGTLSSEAPVQQPAAGKPLISSWAQADVSAAIAAGIVPDTMQSRYTDNITRAEFCDLAAAVFDEVIDWHLISIKAWDWEMRKQSFFTDTKNENVHKMAFFGVVGGVGDGKFDPDAELTREQAAVMLSNMVAALYVPLKAQAPAFSDAGKISKWAAQAVGQVQAAGVMGGVGGGAFDPAGKYTREQSICTMLRVYRMLEKAYHDGPTAQEAYDAMIAFQTDYPEGTPWTEDNVYTWRGDTYFWTTGTACQAFTMMLSDAVFGLAQARYVEASFETVRPGDILCYQNEYENHAVIVLEVKSDHVVVTEGNYNNTVHWGRVFSASEVDRADMMVTRYPED